MTFRTFFPVANSLFRALRLVVAGLALVVLGRAHFPFSYSAAESIGLVQAAVHPGFGSVTGAEVPLVRTEFDYLRLQPFVEGHSWHYRGTISNTRVTQPAELRVEVLSVRREGEGANERVDYTLRHTVTFGTVSAVTTLTGVVDRDGDRVLTTTTSSTSRTFPTLERSFLAGGLLGMPRRLRENPYESTGYRVSYARMAETVGGRLTEGLGSEMQVSEGRLGSVTIAEGTFETLAVTQKLIHGTPLVAPTLREDGSVFSFNSFISRPPDISIVSHYATGVGPVRIAWTQTEVQREPVRGTLELVATNFPIEPRPIRQPQIVTNPMPQALEPGVTLVLIAEVIGVRPPEYRSFVAASESEIADAAGTQYRWATPRGVRWTTSPNFWLQPVAATDAGLYRLDVVTPYGIAEGAPTLVTVTPRATASRLTNVASRAPAGAAAGPIIAGIVLNPGASGSATTRRLLFRAVGPALRAFGLDEAEPDPTLVVFDAANREIARCDNWDSSPVVAAQVGAAVAGLGTFPLLAGSRDAALVLDLAPGAYTAHLLGTAAEAPAVGLIEIYDASGGASGPRIGNLSTRCFLGANGEILIPGIVVTQGSARLLVRALGPALARLGVADALPDPEIALYSGDTLIAANDDWYSATASISNSYALVHSVSQLAGASLFAGSSRDAAMVVTVPAGSYTLHVRSQNPKQSGAVVAEVFLLNP